MSERSNIDPVILQSIARLVSQSVAKDLGLNSKTFRVKVSARSSKDLFLDIRIPRVRKKLPKTFFSDVRRHATLAAKQAGEDRFPTVLPTVSKDQEIAA